MSLLSRVILPDLGAEAESEDILSAHLEHLFSDYTPNAHGDPGSLIIYKSSRFGDVVLQIPTQPDKEGGRLLFAHHLWNAALVAAEAIERASNEVIPPRAVESFTSNDHDDSWRDLDWDKKYWDVRDTNVLELGAGTALPSIISLLSGAASITITDHPSSAAVTTNTISKNISQNLKRLPITKKETDQSATNPIISPPSFAALPSHVSIYGYTWGTTSFYEAAAAIASPHIAPTTKSNQNPILSAQQPKPDSFDKILIADCLWMSSQHSAILKTIRTYLKPNSNSDLNPKNSHASSAKSIPSALVIAGYHTGRGIVADFFRLVTKTCDPDPDPDPDPNPNSNFNSNYIATKLDDADEGQSNNNNKDEHKGKSKEQTSSHIPSKLAIAEIFEVDVDGGRREWMLDREERRDEDKRWCVCAAVIKIPV